MDKLKRLQPVRSRDTASPLKRQSVAVSSGASFDHPSSSSSPTQTRATKASSLSLDDILRAGETAFHTNSTGTPSVTLTSDQDHYTTGGPLSSPQPRPRMTSRSAEPEYGNTRALSRFLLATGPDLDDALVLEEGGTS